MYSKWSKFLLLIFLGLIGVAVVLEVGLRILGANHPVLYQTDPVLGYRLEPDQGVTFFGNAISINRHGVRDERDFDSRLPDTTRILVLGDSVTWGGVRLSQRDLFTSVLERELGDAEVINAGINGYSVWRMTALYREYLRGLQPDVIVLYLIPGDFHRAAVVDLVRTSPAFPLKKPAFALSSALASARIVLAAKLDWDWLQPERPDKPRDTLAAEDRVRQNIEAITQFARELSEDQRLLVVVSPFSDHSKNPPLPLSVNEAMDDAGIEILNLKDEDLRAPDNFADHIHLSTQGHARVGRTLAEYLRSTERKEN